ncbi:MAG: Maf family protein, partial [Actinobacteria bacterium]|nr:Maf family protein [Actinomycetota bacterium]
MRLSELAPGLVLGDRVQLGDGVRLGAHVVIHDDTVIGDRCEIQDGVVLGKPRDEDEAVRMLSTLRGRSHVVWTGVAVADQRPRIGLQGDLAVPAAATACLHAGLVDGELVRPRGEAAAALERVELVEHVHRSVVGGLHRQVVAVAGRQRPGTAGCLEPGGTQQQRMQVCDGLLTLGTGRTQCGQPLRGRVVHVAHRPLCVRVGGDLHGGRSGH